MIPSVHLKRFTQNSHRCFQQTVLSSQTIAASLLLVLMLLILDHWGKGKTEIRESDPQRILIVTGSIRKRLDQF